MNNYYDKEDDMKYANDFRVLTMASIEEILTSLYGTSECDRTSGCYSNGTWFSVDRILSELADYAEEEET